MRKFSILFCFVSSVFEGANRVVVVCAPAVICPHLLNCSAVLGTEILLEPFVVDVLDESVVLLDRSYQINLKFSISAISNPQWLRKCTGKKATFNNCSSCSAGISAAPAVKSLSPE